MAHRMPACNDIYLFSLVQRLWQTSIIVSKLPSLTRHAASMMVSVSRASPAHPPLAIQNKMLLYNAANEVFVLK